MKTSQNKFYVGQFVFYKTKISIVYAKIENIKNQICEFEGGDKMPQEKCFTSIEKLAQGNKNGRSPYVT